MFCVLYFSALLFCFFQSTNLFVAYYSDKFNSTEKGPAQLIPSFDQDFAKDSNKRNGREGREDTDDYVEQLVLQYADF